MPPAAGTIVHGWPVGLAMVGVVVGRRIGATRRRAALNRALHELRRPLQALALERPGPMGALGPGTTVALAIDALDALDREVNGSRAARPWPRPIACRALAAQAVERWRVSAAAAGRSLDLDCRATEARVRADPGRIAQALDGLISNALEHGGPRARLLVTEAAGLVRLAVIDAAPTPPSSRGVERDPRRGHGLGIVARIAAEHGGRFQLDRSPRETVASIELPAA
jgi:signal transduction histidine kinase